MQKNEAPASAAAHLPQLVADLAWLEQYALRRKADHSELIRLRLAEAVIANGLGPWLSGHRGGPLQVAVVGGAGAGKSTVTNFLIGQALAESNPQAGFTRHPIAYCLREGPQPRTSAPGRLGRLRLQEEARSGDWDEEVFQVRSANVDPEVRSALRQVVVWDCPDMTTWQAHHYTARLIEVLGLADLVFYAASDERYNDAIPTQFLHLVLQAGKPVVAVLLKMQPHQAPQLIEHFRKEIIAKMPECIRVAACLAVPHLPAESLRDPAGKAVQERLPLLEQIDWWSGRAEAARRQTALAAADFLEQRQEELLGPARRDLQALATWRGVVDRGMEAFRARYLKEYLSGEQFPRFNAALLRLMELLELPGVGQIVSKALYVVRTPYRLAKGFLQRVSGKVPTAALPEEPVLRSAFNAWLDLLRKEAAVRADHPLWEQLKREMEKTLAPAATEQLTRMLGDFQQRISQEVEQTARAIYEDLEKQPTALNTLRGAKFAVEFASIAGTVVFLGANVIMDVVLVPVVAALTQELMELLGKQYVDRQRERTRARQQELFEATLARPLAEFLRNWPATGMAEVDQLEALVRRIPENLARLVAQVREVRE